MVIDKLDILAFGIAKEIMGSSKVAFEIQLPTNAADLKEAILKKYPRFEDIRSMGIAINNEYSSGSELILYGDEVAVIPPVSGG